MSGAAAISSAAAQLEAAARPLLAHDALPDSLAFCRRRPRGGLGGRWRVGEERVAAGKLRGTPRFAQATTDAVARPYPRGLSCALGVTIGKEETPKLYGLLRRMLVDASDCRRTARKNKYERVRPFVVHKEATCYPKDEPLLRTDGPYPSGHSAVGWGLALVLAEPRA